MKVFLLFLKQNICLFVLLVIFVFFLQETAQASLESSLIGIKTKLVGVIFPLIATIGLVVATLSFISGNPNARQHIAYAIIGSAIGFGAQSIVDSLSYIVH